jgi:hypothetical protein
VGVIFLTLGTISVFMIKPSMKAVATKGEHTWLKYKFCILLACKDFIYGMCLIGTLITEMGYLLSFLYMTGWIIDYYGNKVDC